MTPNFNPVKHATLLLTAGLAALSTAMHAQNACESCTLQFNATALPPVEIACSEGDPLQHLPNFPGYTTSCSPGFWTSIFKYTVGAQSECTGVRPATLPSSFGSIHLGDFTATGLATTNKFNETAEGLTWTVYPENVARLRGTVANANDITAEFEVDLYFNQPQTGAEWTADGGNINASAAGPGGTEDWTVWQIKPHISKLIGKGSLAGHNLHLESSNIAVSYPFQEGNGANGWDNGSGLGGTFDWSACVAGVVYEGYGLTSSSFTSCEESTSLCASDFDAVAQFFIGNLHSFDQIEGTVNVTDNTPPVLSNLPPNYTLNCPVELAELDANHDVTASDNCSTTELALTETYVNGDCPSEFTRTRIFTATDGCGLSTSHTQTVVVVDQVPPVLTVPGNATFSCSDGPTYDAAVAADACDGNIAVFESEPLFVDGDCPGEYTIHRSFTATDLCGNTTSGAQTIQVRDLTPPVLTMPDDVVLPCGSSFVYPPATATDDCTDQENISISIFNSLPPTSCPQEYILERRFLATDLCGNSTLEIQTVTVTDNDLPYFTFVPADATYSCDEEPVFASATATDDCSSFEISTTMDTVFADCPDNYDLIRTFVVVDACGNFAEAQQVISIRDNTPPAILSSVEDETTECSEVWSPGLLEATDNCSGVSWSTLIDTVGTPNSGAYTLNVTHLASDACGNSSSLSQTVTVVDTTPPAFSSVPADLSLSCEVEIPFEMAFAVDECSAVTVTVNDDLQLEVSPGEHLLTRTFTATDAQGNTATAVQLIAISDFTAPAFTSVPVDYTVECSDEMPMDGALAVDNCGEVSISVESTTTPGNAAGNYTITRTFTATDDAGNSSSAVQTITVQDTTAPEFTFVPANYTVECSDAMPLDEAAASDNCSDVTLTVESATTPGNAAGNYTITRTFTATDDAGNSSSAVQTITVQDTTAPEFTFVPANYTVECSDAMPLDEAAASDNCGEVSIAVESSTAPGNATGNYTITRIFTATDDAGNSTSAVQTITVQDTTGPEFTFVPADYSVECSDVLTLDEALGSDNCGEVSISVESTTTSGGATGNYTVVRVFTATDDAGNSTSAVQTITVQDTTAPEFTFVPADYTTECSEPLAIESATATDNCSGVSLAIDVATSFGDASGNYTITRTFTATDDAGNSATAVQTIIVQDTTPPQFTFVPQDYTSECSDPLEIESASATDNCGPVTMAVDVSTAFGNASGNYTVTRTFTATDDAGNSSIAVQTITVQDTTAPEFTFVPQDYSTECPEDVILEAALASDNCGPVVVSVFSESTPEDGTTNFILVRTFTATDDAGNNSSATQTITVQDTTSPEFTFVPSDYTVECSDEIHMENAIATDNCGEVTVLVESATTPGNAAGNYTIARTFTAVDSGGNSASAVQTITVQDTTPPAFSFVPADYTVECSEEMLLEEATASDNCGEVTVTSTSAIEPGNASGNYILTRTFTATDDAGNSVSVVQTITVQDTTAPTFVYTPEDEFLECTDDWPSAVPTVEDACGSFELTLSTDTLPGTCGDLVTVLRTYTATDDAGNASTYTQTLTQVDTQGPIITADDEVDLSCSQNVNELTLPTVIDLCSGIAELTWNDVESSGGCTLPISALLRTYTATDGCGNATQFEQVIQLTDSEAPTWTYVPEDITLECSVEYVLQPAQASDNCAEPDVTWTVDTVGIVATGVYDLVFDFVAVDDCDNTNVHQHVVHVVDTEAPSWAFFPEDHVMTCEGILDTSLPEALDACSESVEVLLLSEEWVAGDCEGTGQWLRTFSATDWNGNVLVSTQTIQVIDDTAPEFTSIPENETLECDEDLPLIPAFAVDNCSNTNVTFEDILEPGVGAGNYVVTRTFVATDACGNSSTSAVVYTVQDTTSPEFTFVPADYTVECSDEMPFDGATASDNCGAVTVAVQSATTPGNALGNYTITRTFTATDDSGNSTVAVQTITVQDTTAPDLTLPEDFTVECSDEMPLDDATASDNCGPVVLEMVTDTLFGNATGNYIVTRTFTATDDAGNSTVGTQTIEVIDSTAPFVTLPPDTTLACDANVPVWTPQAEDNCGEISWESTDEIVEGDCPGSSTILRHYVISDDAGNTTLGTQTISLVDLTAPEFTYVPEAEIWECNAPAELDSAQAMDNCSNVVLAAVLDTLDALEANQWILMVTWTATDGCGNQAQASQEIQVLDQLAPTLDAGPDNASLSWGDSLLLDLWQSELVFSDSCTDLDDLVVSVDVDTMVASVPCIDEVALTWTVSDLAGNEATWEQLVELVDNDAPQWSFEPENMTLACDEFWSPLLPEGSDHNEFSVAQSLDTVPGSCPSNYTVVWSLHAEDVCGNVAEPWVQTVSFVDSVAPSILSWPADLLLSNASEVPECGLEQVEWSENCSSVLDSCATDTVEIYCPGSFLLSRTFSITDGCGNAASVHQSILVEDVEPPVWVNFPSSVVVPCDSVLDAIPPSDLILLDNASNEEDILSELLESVYNGDNCQWDYTHVYQATDACGNATELTSYAVTFVDDTPPNLVTPLEPLDLLCVSEIPSCQETVVDAVDGCNTWSFGCSDAFEGGDCTGPDCVLIRTITVTDACENEASFVQTISIAEPPTVPDLPSGFSPNNDSFNDVYQIRNAGPDLGIPPCDWLENTVFSVYDRWGSLVYRSEDISIPWDGSNLSGRPLPVGTYFVVLEVNGLTYRETVDLRR